MRYDCSMRSDAVPDPPELSDGVIRLRRRGLKDTASIAAASQDSESRRWLTDPPRPDEDPRASLERVDEAFTSGRSAPLVIADALTDDALGLVNVQFRDDRLATLAYSVFPGARGRGIAGRAVALVSTWGFAELGLTELRLEIDPDNFSSRRVAEKSGWTLLEGVTSSEGGLVFRRPAPGRL
jgi:RimJ/RimL family protein N-acetyltransferase